MKILPVRPNIVRNIFWQFSRLDFFCCPQHFQVKCSWNQKKARGKLKKKKCHEHFKMSRKKNSATFPLNFSGKKKSGEVVWFHNIWYFPLIPIFYLPWTSANKGWGGINIMSTVIEIVTIRKHYMIGVQYHIQEEMKIFSTHNSYLYTLNHRSSKITKTKDDCLSPSTWSFLIFSFLRLNIIRKF